METIQARNVNHPEHRENLKAEKYNWIRAAILAALPAFDSGMSMSFDALEDKVHAHLEEKGAPKALFPKPGSVRWYTKTVQLDLEARGEIERVQDQAPIRLRKRKAS